STTSKREYHNTRVLDKAADILILSAALIVKHHNDIALGAFSMWSGFQFSASFKTLYCILNQFGVQEAITRFQAWCIENISQDPALTSRLTNPQLLAFALNGPLEVRHPSSRSANADTLPPSKPYLREFGIRDLFPTTLDSPGRRCSRLKDIAYGTSKLLNITLPAEISYTSPDQVIIEAFVEQLVKLGILTLMTHGWYSTSSQQGGLSFETTKEGHGGWHPRMFYADVLQSPLGFESKCLLKGRLQVAYDTLLNEKTDNAKGTYTLNFKNAKQVKTGKYGCGIFKSIEILRHLQLHSSCRNSLTDSECKAPSNLKNRCEPVRDGLILHSPCRTLQIDLRSPLQVLLNKPPTPKLKSDTLVFIPFHDKSNARLPSAWKLGSKVWRMPGVLLGKDFTYVIRIEDCESDQEYHGIPLGSASFGKQRKGKVDPVISKLSASYKVIPIKTQAFLVRVVEGVAGGRRVREVDVGFPLFNYQTPKEKVELL
ncbi:hypothetical protein HDV05_000700, partial [Chytridiales sp. JEL 0842]